mmetsp:Transcript_30031/g.54737  ORF Transcript_30031/g.54737 Transcript_30031/m.54737 type:complete len:213 (+) Transcript_30031:72-710(+)
MKQLSTTLTAHPSALSSGPQAALVEECSHTQAASCCLAGNVILGSLLHHRSGPDHQRCGTDVICKRKCHSHLCPALDALTSHTDVLGRALGLCTVSRSEALHCTGNQQSPPHHTYNECTGNPPCSCQSNCATRCPHSSRGALCTRNAHPRNPGAETACPCTTGQRKVPQCVRNWPQPIFPLLALQAQPMLVGQKQVQSGPGRKPATSYPLQL